MPAFRRVEPVITSGPTGTSIRKWVRGASADVITAVSAPAASAAASAPSTYGVRAARGHADHDVAGRRAQRAQLGRAGVRVVLGRGLLDGAGRQVGAGDERERRHPR